MAEEQEDNNRSLPSSELDMNMMVTNSTWGMNEVSPQLKETLTKYYLEKDHEGNEFVSKSNMWGLLSYYTRDIRLGNLSYWDGELQTCRYHLELAGDLLYAGYIEPFLICLSRAISIIETSQSKGGFFRKIMNTLRKENINQEIAPPKKQFFGGGDKQGGLQ